jgi:eukaryotic-like serine/threonine-protein kinase
MKRFFTLLLGALAMIAVALISAFIAMRLAIHGREAVVPTLTGLTVSEASNLAAHRGLRLNLENRFYSADVAAGRILAQDPAPGSRVRREWPVRVTESLGNQRVNVPDLTGKSERGASISIRRLSLDLGAVAHLSVPGDPDVVVAQTPSANSGGVDGPRVSLLVSDAAGTEPPAYVMPALVGLSYAGASARGGAAGLHVVGLAETPVAPPAGQAATETPVAPIVPPVPSNGVVVAQTPQAGRRVQQGDAVHVTVAPRKEGTVSGPAQ